MKLRTFAILPLMLAAASANAGEIFVGAFAQDVETPITRSGQENGIGLQLGWRGDRIRALQAIGGPSPHVVASLNTGGGTSFASAGISWKIGRTYYLRPGIGMAIHNGRHRNNVTPDRIDFGSRILFVPEIAIGTRVSERASIEASWVHLSHAKLFSPQNPGSDNFGIRLNYRLR